MISVDFDYLRRIATRPHPAAILQEQKFLDAQKLFFEVVTELGGSVDFEIADMHEIHAIAALGDSVKGKRVLDLGCGSPEPYVLEDTFRDRYPPFVAEMLVKRGAIVTGVDHRPNKTARYDHRMIDLTDPQWMSSLKPPYDIVLAFSLFNAPESPFEHDPALCDRLMSDVRPLLASDGVFIVNLRDELFSDSSNESGVRAYVESRGFEMVHLDGNCAWLGLA